MRDPLRPFGLPSPFLRAHGDMVAPVITGQSYDTPTNTLSADVSEGGTLYALFSASATLLDAAIQSGATFTGAVDAGINSVVISEIGLTPGTWYLQWGVMDAAGNFSQGTPVTRVVAVPSAVETFSAYTVGDGYTQLNAGSPNYVRSSSSLTTAIVADANSTSGKALSLGVSSNAFYYMTKSDFNAILAARTTEVVQVLVKFRLVATSTTQRAGFGRQASSLNTGFRFARTAVNSNFVGIQVAGDVNTATNYSAILSGVADGGLYSGRLEINGNDLKGRIWADGAGEPGTWTTITSGSAVVFDNLALIGRASTPGIQLLGFSASVGGTAASF